MLLGNIYILYRQPIKYAKKSSRQSFPGDNVGLDRKNRVVEKIDNKRQCAGADCKKNRLKPSVQKLSDGERKYI